MCMSKKKFLIRLDDACPTMNIERWDKVENILDAFSIKPMVGIIPDCKDKSFQNNADPNFWNKGLELISSYIDELERLDKKLGL